MRSPIGRRLFNLHEVSEFLNLSIPTIRGLISSGKLHVVRSGPGAKLLVDVVELEAYIKRNTQSNDAREEVK